MKMDREQIGELLSAYLDGELNTEQTEAVERLLQEDAEARRRLDELARVAKLVGGLPRQPAPSSIADDIDAHLERAALMGGVSEADLPEPSKRSPVWAALSMAAMLGLVMVGVWYMWEGAGVSPLDRPGRVALAPEPEAIDDVREEALVLTDENALAVSGMEAMDPTWLASATFEQKLQIGVPLDAVDEHDFSNEPVRLQVVVDSETDRDALAASLVRHLSDHRARNLKTALAEAKREASVDKAAFFYEGAPDRNFRGCKERQLLVRASRRDLVSLVDVVAKETSESEAVALLAGPVAIRGVESTQRVLRDLPGTQLAAEVEDARLDDAVAVSAEKELDESGRDSGPLPPANGWLGLLKVVGLPQELFLPSPIEDESFSEAAEVGPPAPDDRNAPKSLSDSETVAMGPLSVQQTAEHGTASRTVSPDSQSPVRERARLQQKVPPQVDPANAERRASARAKRQSDDDGHFDAAARAAEAPSSLVERRVTELRQRAAAHRDGAASDADDELVTLVVEVKVRHPARAQPESKREPSAPDPPKAPPSR